MKMLGTLCLLGALLAPATCLARDVAVITQKDNAFSAINSADLQKLLKTDAPKWPDGSKVVVILGDPGSVESRFLLEKVFKVAPSEMTAFLEGHKDTILVLRSDDLVLKAVAGRPGSIGVVNVYSINSAVKVLRVDGKLPLEQGYLLHGN
ncbi:MAG TPA: hypothetical protein VKY85_14820 [Candidatus Angelobacter sp.]|jgi:hypothetical protein|nr:hypothetical protein [Candidatus Angelobacter sp.]